MLDKTILDICIANQRHQTVVMASKAKLLLPHVKLVASCNNTTQINVKISIKMIVASR